MGFGALLSVVDRQNAAHLGELVTYTPSVGAPAVPRGIFDATYAPIDGGNHANVAGAHPAIFFRLVDLPTDPETDDPTITLGAVFAAEVRGNYTVAEVHKDGMGGVILVLQKV